MPRLIVIKGPDEGKQFELVGANLGLGRDAGNAIRLHDTEISRRHAEFRSAENGYLLVDKGSANGTFLNNQPVQEALLKSGDQIQIGQSLLVYSAGRSDAPARSDLAERISMISRQENELSSAIVKTVSEAEGSRILTQPEKAGTHWLRTALANLAIMYEAIHTVSHIVDLEELLEKVMDLIFRSIQADRGCMMLRITDSDQFEAKAIRWRKKPPAEEKMVVSRTIMDYVLENKQGILVSDAARDERFHAGQSVVRFGIREAICVPMKGRHNTLGVLYLDTHTLAADPLQEEKPQPKFTEDHLKLAIAIAHQAALAVEDTRYHRAMVQAERLAAIGQAIAALSHHIKNILQGLRSGGEILKMGLDEKNEGLLRKGWKILEKNQGKIYELVLDMLSYSKEREPALEPVDLNRIVQDVLELMQSRAKDLNVTLEACLQKDLPVTAADPEGIHRALLNIVTNAIDAVEDRPQARVRVSTSLEECGSWLRLTVEDNGIGIPPEKQPDIFKPFVSSKGARGTGLGLAVSRKTLREHGGDILLHSQPQLGSTFILRLPQKSPSNPDLQATLMDLQIEPPPEAS